jgi:hypothetical protein
MFWWGLICGLFLGSWIGLFLAAMCVAADKRYDPPNSDKEGLADELFKNILEEKQINNSGNTS